MHTISRTGGIGLIVYGLGSTIGFFGAGAPGGDYKESSVTGFIAAGHASTGILLSTLGALAAIALLVFAHELRGLGDTAGHIVWGLAVAAVATAVTGAFVVAGVEYAMIEAGPAVQTTIPHSVVYTIAEIGNLVATCAPALLVGVAALVIAFRGRLPLWLRVTTVIAAVCGITAPLFFTYFVFVFWTVVLGGWAAAPRRAQADRLVAKAA